MGSFGFAVFDSLVSDTASSSFGGFGILTARAGVGASAVVATVASWFDWCIVATASRTVVPAVTTVVSTASYAVAVVFGIL